MQVQLREKLNTAKTCVMGNALYTNSFTD